MTEHKRWTRCDDLYVQLHYYPDGSRAVADALGRTRAAVIMRAKRMDCVGKPGPKTPKEPESIYARLLADPFVRWLLPALPSEVGERIGL